MTCYVFQQQGRVAIDNSRALLVNLLRHMASSYVAVRDDDRAMTLRHNDALVLSQSVCSRASSSSSTSSERHTTSSSADSGLAMHCVSASLHSVINDVMNVTSDDNYTSFVDAVVDFIKVQFSLSVSNCLSPSCYMLHILTLSPPTPLWLYTLPYWSNPPF